MILAAIAMFAALNTRSDYQFVDVSQIDVTGDKEASVGENIKGEHVARFYEWLAESKWIMKKCGANIPASLRSWNPPTVHNVSTMQDALTAYRDATISSETSNVKWFSADGAGDNLVCFERSYNGDVSSDTIANIADQAWSKFCNYNGVDNSRYIMPSSVTIPSVAVGDSVTSSIVNLANSRSTGSFDVRWVRMGANRAWTFKDSSYTITTFPNQSHTFTEYLEYNPSYMDRDPFVYEPLRSSQFNPSYQFGGNNWSIRNIIKGQGVSSVTPFSVSMITGSSQKLESSSGEIVGRDGIKLDSRGIVVFFCCWKCSYNSSDDTYSMNVKVFSRNYYFGCDSISRMADDSWNATQAPSSGDFHSGYVAVLFVAHGYAHFRPNASTID